MTFRTMFGLLVSVLLAGCQTVYGQPAQSLGSAKPEPAFAKVTDDPALPRVLLIGDSISIGYTVPVRERLAGKANVHRPSENGGPTTNGLGNLRQWISDGKWDVIHFNFGLHDLKRMDDGKQQVPLADYEKNLAEIVRILKGTGAKLIWASTTPVPEGNVKPPRVPGDVALYNEAAARVMKANDIPIDDLYAFALPRLGDIQLPVNVHYTKPGYEALASQVAASIEAALPKH
jgi:acyl-CoA thioesterase-1